MKYILEVDDEPLVRGDTVVYKAVGFNTLVFDSNGLSKLKPYKPEEIRKDGCEAAKHECGDCPKGKGCTNCPHVFSAYIEGRNEMWEAAKKVVLSEADGGLQWQVRENMFQHTNYGIFKTFDADEVIERIRLVEKRDKEVRLWDEVENGYGEKGFVLNVRESNITVLRLKDGRPVTCIWHNGDYHKTGVSHRDIEDIMKKMAAVPEGE